MALCIVININEESFYKTIVNLTLDFFNVDYNSEVEGWLDMD